MEDFISRVKKEREKQLAMNWSDENNSAGQFVAYIANLASRWAMPIKFAPEKYTFDYCMVQVATTAMAAYNWYLSNDNPEKVSGEVDGVSKSFKPIRDEPLPPHVETYLGTDDS